MWSFIKCDKQPNPIPNTEDTMTHGTLTDQIRDIFDAWDALKVAEQEVIGRQEEIADRINKYAANALTEYKAGDWVYAKTYDPYVTKEVVRKFQILGTAGHLDETTGKVTVYYVAQKYNTNGKSVVGPHEHLIPKRITSKI